MIAPRKITTKGPKQDRGKPKKSKHGQKHVPKTSKKRIQSQSKIYSMISLRNITTKGPEKRPRKTPEAQTCTKTCPENIKKTDPISE